MNSLNRTRASTRHCPSQANPFNEAHIGLAILGGSWVVISGVISPLIWDISIVTLLITLFITAHEPPSRGFGV